MPLIGAIKNSMSAIERVVFLTALIILAISLSIRAIVLVNENSVFVPVRGGSYAEGVVGQPTLINPAVSQNPADMDISALVFSTISDVSANMDVKSDEKTYDVKIKEKLVWSDGEPLTSDDVIFTIQTIQNPDSNSPSAKNWQGISIERVSELHVTFTLPDPFSFFPEVLRRTRVIPKHIFGDIPIENYRLSEYSLEPVGSGPYKVLSFKKRKDGFITEYHMVPNEKFSGTAPNIRDFYIRFYKNQEDLRQAFLARKVNGFGSMSPIAEIADEAGRLVIDALPMPRYYAIFINQPSNPALKNISVRRALDLAIDKEKLSELIGKNTANPISSPLVPAAGGESLSSYDHDSARALLETAKASDMRLNLSVPNSPLFGEVADFIKRAWVSAGVGEVNIIMMDTDAVLEDAVRTRDFELLLFGNILEDPLDLFPFWYSSQKIPPKLNIVSYQNTEVDRLIENARKTSDKDEQLRLASRAATLIKNDLPAIFLFTMPYFYVHTEKLTGLSPETITMSSDRFKNVTDWSVLKARVLQ